MASAQRELVRIGIDRPGGRHRLAGGLDRRRAAVLPDGDFADLAQVRHHRRVVVLDVRRTSKVGQGHLLGAVHVPLHELLNRLSDVPAGEGGVHCRSGCRAAIAASLLAAAGHRVVAINDDDTTCTAGLDIATPQAVPR